MNKKYTIKNIDTFQEDNAWYMSIVAEVETDNNVSELRIPKAKLADVNQPLGFRTGLVCGVEKWVHLLLDDCEGNEIAYPCVETLQLDSMKRTYYTVKVIKEKTHELTLEEIEKKLGYKVKIVSKK